MRGAGFKLLFDGKTLNGWKAWGKSEMPKVWSVEEGVLVVSPGEEHGDIRTEAEFRDFELRLEWKVSQGANSGIFYRASEKHGAVYLSGPEYQILDDEHGAGGKNPLTAAGSLYDVYPPSAKVSRQAGQWNDARIVVRGNRIEHWLNGVRVVSCRLGSKDWNSRVSESKFREREMFGKAPSGPIVLQDHGYKVWFRNIRIRAF